MSKLGATFAFLLGAAVGGAATWYFAREKYAKLAEDEINSVKKSFAQLEKKRAADNVATNQDAQRDSITEDIAVGDGEVVLDNMKIYTISPDEFGEIDDYDKISLTYFADGVLADEYGIIVENVEELLGDGLDHFGEYEEDSVFVRNELRSTDYEILKDLRTYADFRKTLPTNI